MSKIAIKNGVLFCILLAIPLLSEFATATKDHVPGTGFSVLLYEPFDFAYILLAGVFFFSLNIFNGGAKSSSLLHRLSLSAILLIMWFIVAFLSVGQLHLSLGGKL